MDYKDGVISDSGYHGQKCPDCGEAMFPADEYGRRICMCKVLGGDRFFKIRYLKSKALSRADSAEHAAAETRKG